MPVTACTDMSGNLFHFVFKHAMERKRKATRPHFARMVDDCWSVALGGIFRVCLWWALWRRNIFVSPLGSLVARLWLRWIVGTSPCEGCLLPMSLTAVNQGACWNFMNSTLRRFYEATHQVWYHRKLRTLY